MSRILVFGDTPGVRQTLRVITRTTVCGLVGAEIRPHYHRELQELAAERRVPLLIQPRVTSAAYPGFVQEVRRLAPELILVNSYSMLLRPDVLSVPVRGAINVHLALLPEYRGCNPIQSALLNDEKETGVTMHYMSAEFDTGDIVAQRRVPIFFTDTWPEILARLQNAAEDLLKEELPKVLVGTNARRPQDESRAHYYGRRYPEDGRIGWEYSVRHIYNLIRALVRPNPGAYYESEGGRVVLDRYMSIRAVTALKYGPVGGERLQGSLVELVPAAPVRCESGESRAAGYGGNDTVRFTIRLVDTGSAVSFCRLFAIDYTRGTAEMQVEPNEMSGAEWQCADAFWPLTRFAEKELGLRRVVCRLEPASDRFRRALETLGFLRVGEPESGTAGESVWVVTTGLSRGPHVGR